MNRVVRHANDEAMRYIKLSNGLSQIVTADHPMITSEGEVPAYSINSTHKLYTASPSVTEEISDSELNEDFGWLVGLCLAEAYTAPYQVALL